MIKKEIIEYSVRNLIKRRARSFLTIVSIFVGIVAIFIFVSFGLGLYTYVNNFATSTSADKVTIMTKGVGATDATFALTENDLKAVEKVYGVLSVSGIYSKPIEIKQGDLKKYVFLLSMDPKKPLFKELSGIKIGNGRDLQSNDNGKVLLGYNYQIKDKIFSEPYNVGDTIEIQGVKHRIVGFFQSIGNPQDDSQVYMTNDYFKEFAQNVTGYNWAIAKVDINDIDGTVKRIEKALRTSRGIEKGKEDFFVSSFQDLLATYMSALDIIVGFIILIALISVVVSAINTANTMFTSVLERTREIGTMKAVGARNSEILKIFILESAILGFVAGTLGVIMGDILTHIAESILNNLGYGFLKPVYPWYLFVGAIAFATITGALSGAIPARRASKLRAVDALRYE